jgi:hypothetical protein
MLKCSHILYRVKDIHKAVQGFISLGFSVHWGSDPQRANNAMIWFNKGPFIELFQFSMIFRPLHFILRWTKGPCAGDRLLKWADASEGWCDIALEPSERSMEYNLEAVRTKLISNKLECSKVIPGKRKRPDGQLVHYTFMAVNPPALPFVVSLYDPPQRPDSIRHENGAAGISRVRLNLHPDHADKFNLLVSGNPLLETRIASPAGKIEVEIDGIEKNLIYKVSGE